MQEDVELQMGLLILEQDGDDKRVSNRVVIIALLEDQKLL
jgi:hypothetical protein